ncbi:MAG: carotenoid oxygenase family protein, partial [Pseudomonadota bacterium]
MSHPFSDNPYLQGHMAPIRMEVDAPDLIVEGDLPEDLNGIFYRNGPDLLYPPRDDAYHWFDGDGMIFAFSFEDGRVHLRNRWVRTEKFDLEREAGRKLYGTFGNPMTSDPAIGDTPYNTANTHVMAHNGRLFALMEGSPAVELDPHSLDTIGSETFGGAAEGPFAAHPKIDYANGEFITYGYQAKGPGTPDVRYNVIDRNSQVAHTVWFEAPYCSLLHDIFITENYVVFPVIARSILMVSG